MNATATAARPWTFGDIPDQTGKVIAVTGANSGLGYETARHLALRGAHVVMACRDAAKAQVAVDGIRAARADAAVEVLPLDLSSLASVRTFAETLRRAHPRIDVLINNAGVMALPPMKTRDGFEMQFGTNHLGHFALTGLLFDVLAQAGTPARVVTVSSLVERMGRIDFDDLQSERRYDKWRAYAQSKLANLLFTYELNRRVQARHPHVVSVAAHPGFASTNLQGVGPRLAGRVFAQRMSALNNRLLAQPAEMGAAPTLYAAVAGDMAGGEFVGPAGLFQLRGAPVKVRAAAHAYDAAVAQRLWEVSVALTGVDFGGL